MTHDPSQVRQHLYRYGGGWITCLKFVARFGLQAHPAPVAMHMIPRWDPLCGGPFRKGIPEGHIARTAFPRDLILFSCRLPKMEALNHSFVYNRIGASECAETASSRHQPHLHCTKHTSSRCPAGSAVQVCRRHESAAMRLPPSSLTSPGTSAGHIARTAFPRDLILFSCRLPKMEALNHSVVCSRFGALDWVKGLFHETLGFPHPPGMSPVRTSNRVPTLVKRGYNR
jgi:hypothetical protein